MKPSLPSYPERLRRPLSVTSACEDRSHRDDVAAAKVQRHVPSSHHSAHLQVHEQYLGDIVEEYCLVNLVERLAGVALRLQSESDRCYDGSGKYEPDETDVVFS